jgi:hypothetical protein
MRHDDQWQFTDALDLNSVLKNSVHRLLKKISEARRAKNRSFGFRSGQARRSVLSQYVGARRLSATKHMRLFQQPAVTGR